MVSHNLQQRGAAEVGGVKFAVEQRMGTAVMLLQEVRNWPGGQGVLIGYELNTDVDLDAAVAIPRDFACDVREKVLSKRYTFCRPVLALSGVRFIFLVMGMFLKMTCGRC